MVLNIIAWALIAWGVLDFGLSWIGTDLYREIGIYLPGWIYNWTAYIAGGIGVVLLTIANKSEVANEDDANESEEP